MANMFEQADRELVSANAKPEETVKQKKPVQEKKPKEEKRPAEKKETAFSAEALLNRKMKDKRKAKSYGFYLDSDVVEALEDLAEKTGTNTSNALNTLLRAILLEK